jgi:hypothetical protein
MPRPDPGLMKGCPPIFRSAYLSRASLAICAPMERLLPGDAVAGLTMIISMNNGLRRYQPWWAQRIKIADSTQAGLHKQSRNGRSDQH